MTDAEEDARLIEEQLRFTEARRDPRQVSACADAQDERTAPRDAKRCPRRSDVFRDGLGPRRTVVHVDYDVKRHVPIAVRWRLGDQLTLRTLPWDDWERWVLRESVRVVALEGREVVDASKLVPVNVVDPTSMSWGLAPDGTWNVTTENDQGESVTTRWGK